MESMDREQNKEVDVKLIAEELEAQVFRIEINLSGGFPPDQDDINCLWAQIELLKKVKP